MNPTLQDLYHFLIEMHGNEEAAQADFAYFMAGKLPEHLIEYCRQAVAAESANAPAKPAPCQKLARVEYGRMA